MGRDADTGAIRRGLFPQWQAARKRTRAELRSVRAQEIALAANLGRAGELPLDRLSDRERMVLPVAPAHSGRRRWLYAERIESSHYGEGVSYLLAETDGDARSLLAEPVIGALYSAYEEATFHLNALAAEDAIAVRDASAAPEADLDPERLRSAARAWFERSAASSELTRAG